MSHGIPEYKIFVDGESDIIEEYKMKISFLFFERKDKVRGECVEDFKEFVRDGMDPSGLYTVWLII